MRATDLSQYVADIATVEAAVKGLFALPRVLCKSPGCMGALFYLMMSVQPRLWRPSAPTRVETISACREIVLCPLQNQSDIADSPGHPLANKGALTNAAKHKEPAFFCSCWMQSRPAAPRDFGGALST